MKIYVPCNNCKDSPNPGVIVMPVVGAVECSCLKEYEGYKRLFKYFISRGVPEKYVDCDIKDYIGTKSAKSLEVLKNIHSAVQSKALPNFQLYIAGKANTQKTSVAVHLLKSFALLSFTIRYITMYDLIEHLKKGVFYKEGQEEDWVDSDIHSTDIVLIDDAFDTEKVYLSEKNKFVNSLLLNFISNRQSKMKSNIFVSRVKRTDIDSNFGLSILELLNDNCIEIELEDVVPQEIRNKRLLDIVHSKL